MKPNVKQFIGSVQTKVAKHSPEILVGIGITGMVTTTVLAVKATPKAIRLIDEAKKEKQDELTKVEVVKATWKCYIPAVTTGVVSAACLVGANSVNAKRNAALATAYKLSETAFNEYRDKVIETVGEKKEQVVKEKVHEEKLKKNPVSKSEVVITEKGGTLCYDVISGRYFKSDIDKIKKAVNELNRQLTQNMFGYISLNDFYDEIGLESIEMGWALGWNLDNGLIDIAFDSKLADDGTPCIVIDYAIRPCYDYTQRR